MFELHAPSMQPATATSIALTLIIDYHYRASVLLSTQEHLWPLIGRLTHWSTGAEILQEPIQRPARWMCAGRQT